MGLRIVTTMAVLAMLAVGLGGCMPGLDDSPKVAIEFGADPEHFLGLPVEIDGKVVGKLEKIGALTRRAFPVTKGEHSVRVVDAGMECKPVTVKAELKMQKIMLLLEYEETTSVADKPALVLRQM